MMLITDMKKSAWAKMIASANRLFGDEIRSDIRGPDAPTTKPVPLPNGVTGSITMTPGEVPQVTIVDARKEEK